MDKSKNFSRKEKVYLKLKELSFNIPKIKIKSYEKVGIETKYIAKLLNMSRSNVSKELNDLFKEKKVVKILGKPMLYIDKEYLENIFNMKIFKFEIYNIDELINSEIPQENNYESDLGIKNNKKISIFDKIIGSKDSLKNHVRQAKAAVLYPPKGLRTLILGPTGVGKTTFAEAMYRYAIEKNVLKKNAPYVIFNCADYANNPQLLLSHLFGHVKGGFTGAETDKMGLIDKANGGILFLDEIHRLPSEGQEMLFSVMDRGKYSRLGETYKEQKSNVLIIAATTENPNSAMLGTFLRRIQVLIELPKLEDRSLKERMVFICQFFNEEYNKTNVPIKVSKEVLKVLLLYRCKGNIGQLKNDIQLICANSFLDYITENNDCMIITLSDISNKFKSGILHIDNKREELIKNFNLNDSGYIIFNKENSDFNVNNVLLYDDYKMKDNFYDIILSNIEKFYENGLSTGQIKNNVNKQITNYFIKKKSKNLNINRKVLYKFVTPDIVNIVSEAFEKNIGKKNLKEISPKIIYNLALHIETLIERVNLHQTIIYPNLDNDYKKYKLEYNISLNIKNKLESKFNISIPNDEVAFITKFIHSINENKEERNIKIIVIAHGDTTASSMVEVAKTLLDYEHIYAIDMPLEEKISTALERTTDLVKKIDDGKGVLMLVDMGSLATFSEIITKETGIKTKVIDMVSTPMVIEAARKAMEPNITIDDIFDSVKNISELIGRKTTIKKVYEDENKFNINNKDKILKMLNDVVTFIDTKKSSKLLENVLISIEKDVGKKVDDVSYIKFLFHCSCMIERIIRKEPLPYNNIECNRLKKNKLFSIVNNRFKSIEEIYGINIPESENAYIVEMLDKAFNI